MWKHKHSAICTTRFMLKLSMCWNARGIQKWNQQNCALEDYWREVSKRSANIKTMNALNTVQVHIVKYSSVNLFSSVNLWPINVYFVFMSTYIWQMPTNLDLFIFIRYNQKGFQSLEQPNISDEHTVHTVSLLFVMEIQAFSFFVSFIFISNYNYILIWWFHFVMIIQVNSWSRYSVESFLSCCLMLLSREAYCVSKQ